MVHAAADSGAEFAKIQSMLSQNLTHRKDLMRVLVSKAAKVRKDL